jgi:hypothetical protein
VATIDNYHNAFPTSLKRVEQIAKQHLPENPTSDDILSTQVRTFEADLTKDDQVRTIFSSFGQGGLWGVIHIAVRQAFPITIHNEHLLHKNRPADGTFT